LSSTFHDPPPRPGLTLASVLRRYERFVRHKLRQRGVPEDQIPDVFQEVLIVVAERLPTFEPEPGLPVDYAMKSWLSTIAARKARACLAVLRRRGAEMPVAHDQLEALGGAGNAVDASFAHSEQWTLLHAFVNDLEPRRRAVFIAYCFEDQDMPEVAAALGISTNTAWNRLRLARADLHAAARRRSARKSNGVLLLMAFLFGEERHFLPDDAAPDHCGRESAAPPRERWPHANRIVYAAAAMLVTLLLCSDTPHARPHADPAMGVMAVAVPATATLHPLTAASADSAPAASTGSVLAASRESVPATSPGSIPAAAAVTVRGRLATTPSRPRAAPLAEPSRGDQAYFEEARDVLQAGRPDVVQWALTEHAAGFAIDALTPERQSLSIAASGSRP